MQSLSTFVNSLSRFSFPVLRIGIGIVFVWFGWSALTNTDMWVRLVPDYATIFTSAATLVKIHGAIELVFGLFLVIGFWVRWSAFILFISLVNTVFLVSGPTRVRDIGLACAALSIFLAPVRRTFGN